MAKEKKESPKKEKLYWKITAPAWVDPILKLKDETSDRYLEAMKAKKGYKVEEA